MARYKSRKWLRPNNSWGARSHIIGDVSSDREGGSVNGDLILGDCNQSISFEYYAWKEKQYRKHLKSLTKLCDELNAFKLAYIKAHDELVANGGFKGDDAPCI